MFEMEVISIFVQNMDKNKGKNMIPLWENAKKTVDGGVEELKLILAEQRRRGDSEESILKLELVERDLEIISMVSLCNKISMVDLCNIIRMVRMCNIIIMASLCNIISMVSLCNITSMVSLCNKISKVSLCNIIRMVRLCNIISMIRLCNIISIVSL